MDPDVSRRSFENRSEMRRVDGEHCSHDREHCSLFTVHCSLFTTAVHNVMFVERPAAETAAPDNRPRGGRRAPPGRAGRSAAGRSAAGLLSGAAGSAASRSANV